MESITSEGTDPATEPPADGEVQERKGTWGGSEKGPFKKEFGQHRSTARDSTDSLKYEKETFGKREFKGKSPLATSKGATLVKKETFLKDLKSKFNDDYTKVHLLSEDALIDERDK